jgi:hypothetical protein
MMIGIKTSMFSGLAILVAATASEAWEFTSQPICTLSDSGGETQIEITYDGQIYTLRLDHPDGWPQGQIFSMRFSPVGPFISTDRHRIIGTVLEVTDTGFGNVLDGLQFNGNATALLGDVAREIRLDDASEPVADFRACDARGLS